MNGRLEKLEKTVAALEKTISRQERRIAALEGESVEVADRTTELPNVVGNVAPEAEPLSGQWSLAALKGTPTLVGRSLLILAGAFLLRALTEAGTLATATGVVLGLLYAASWIVMAAVAAGGGARVSAGFYGVCAASIAYPLIFEATTEFGVLSTTASVAILVFVTVAGLVMAFRWRLQESAWVFSLGAMLTASTLAVVRPPGEAETAVLVALGLAAVWLAGARGWESLRWLTAVGALVGVLRLTAMASAPDGMPEGFGPFHLPFIAFLQAAVLLGYVGSSFVRAVRGRLQLRLFDFVQTAAAWAVGWGGAVQLARANDVGTGWLAVCAFVVGLAAYGGAFGVVDRREGHNRSFLYLSTLGLGLVLLGLPGIAGGAAPAVWSLLALAAAAAGSRWDRVTLSAHAALLLLAAWLASGVAAETAADLGGRPGFEAVPGGVAIIVAILTVATTMVVLFTRRLSTSGRFHRLPLTAMLVMSGMIVAATLVSVAELAAPGSASWMGTVALSAVTIGAAVLASRWGIREAGWLVYPLLALTGLRVVFTDLASGRTTIFVVALAAYGAALIASPKILRSRRVQD